MVHVSVLQKCPGQTVDARDVGQLSSTQHQDMQHHMSWFARGYVISQMFRIMRVTLLTIVGIAGIETSTSQIGRVHGAAETIARRVTLAKKDMPSSLDPLQFFILDFSLSCMMDASFLWPLPKTLLQPWLTMVPTTLYVPVCMLLATCRHMPSFRRHLTAWALCLAVSRASAC